MQWENAPGFTVSYQHYSAEITKDDLLALKDIADTVLWLDLAESTLSPDALEALTHFKHLKRLQLEKSNVSNEALAHVAKLNGLEYLNIYGTTLDDGCVEHLSELKSLSKLYTWQTKISQAGIKQIKAALPGAVQ